MKFKIISKTQEIVNKMGEKQNDRFLFSSKGAATNFQEKFNLEMDNYRRELSKKAKASEQEAETIILTS